MALALVLVLIVVGAVLFHFLSPWTFTPLMSNWSQIDFTMAFTIAITGVVFIAVNLFLAYTVVRYRRREGHKADHIAENRKLEWTLIGITSLGIFVLLAPGLFVYSELISPPAESLTLEVVGEQWRWSYRFAGADGEFGRVDPKLISTANPFGIDPEDPAGRDDRLVQSSEVHLPVDRPVKLNLRSKDVLHDFYVPPFRVKMDAVPGMVTSTWFTPTQTGTFEAVCAEYCGLGHHAMRGLVVVEEQAAFESWLAGNSTYAQMTGDDGGDGDQSTGDPLVDRGMQLAQNRGCLGCHSVDGSDAVGPTWRGLFGRETPLADGSTVQADQDYLRESILQPTAKVVEGYQPVMPPYDLGDEELDALIAYIESLSEDQ